MDPIELVAFLDWLERSRRTVLCRKDQFFDGANERHENVELFYTLSEVEEWVNQWKADEDS